VTPATTPHSPRRPRRPSRSEGRAGGAAPAAAHAGPCGPAPAAPDGDAGPAGSAGRDGFIQSLHAEWTKLRTVRGWVLAMVGAALVTVVVGLFGTAGEIPGHHPAHPSLPLGPASEAVNDSFYFVHQPQQRDGSITVKVTSLTGVVDLGPGGPRNGTQPWAKAGIIVKANLKQGSAYAAIMVTPGHGVRMQYNYTHDVAGIPGSVSANSPRWLRLTRAGDTITGYDSADGLTWTKVGSAKLTGLPSTVQTGPFVTSPEEMEPATIGAAVNPAVATAVFGNADLRGGRRQGAWKGENVGGDAGTSGSYTGTIRGGFTESAGTFTVTGAGDIAPVVGGPALGPGNTIENFLVGAFAGLIVVIVVGTMFITAEYRRGLIRTTLAASPRRGRMLTAKAIVVGTTAFAAGLVAAVVTIPLDERRAHASGFYVFPVTSPTELRVVVGTAMLFALAAVFALAVGTILRRSAAAVAIVTAAIVVPYILAVSGVLPAGPADWLLRVTPAAGFAIQQTLPHYTQVMTLYTPSSGYYPLAPLAGFAVLCGYVTLAFGIAVVLLRRRDA
jgi:ABC-type transport system involved in multi-copper enzyme maturation permease subunit